MAFEIIRNKTAFDIEQILSLRIDLYFVYNVLNSFLSAFFVVVQPCCPCRCFECHYLISLFLITVRVNVSVCFIYFL